MNKSFCACHTAALRIFVRSLAGSSARQPFALVPAAAHGLADQQTDAGGQRPMRAVYAHTTALHSIARFHTIRPRYNAQAAPVSATPAAELTTEPTGPTGSTDTQMTAFPVQATTSTEEQSVSNSLTAAAATDGLLCAPTAIEIPISEATPEAQDAAQHAAPQYPGKNRRKKLRRQKEAEVAAAVPAPDAADARDTVGETEGALGMGIGASTSVTDAEKGTTTSTTAEVAAAASIPGTAAKKEKKKKATRPRESKTDWVAKREKGTKITTKATKAKETKTWQKKTATEPNGADENDKKEKKQKKQKAERAARPAAPLQFPPKTKTEPWQIQKHALREKFQGEGWNPRKKLSPDALEGIRALHKQMPDVYTTPVLAKHFAVSPEAIRRILKSKWQPTAAEEEDRQERWFDRGKQVWQRWAALGKKPPKRWQAEGIRRDNPRRARQQQERTRRQVRAAWQRKEMGAMGGMGMLGGDGAAVRSPGASGVTAAEAGDRHAGVSREPVSDRGTDGLSLAEQPRQSPSLGKRIRLAQQTAQGKQ